MFFVMTEDFKAHLDLDCPAVLGDKRSVDVEKYFRLQADMDL